MDEFEIKLKHAFLDEATQTLVETDLLFLSLERGILGKNTLDEETFAELFRHIHNLKGAAGVAGFENLGRFVHQVESLIQRMRQGARDRTTLLLLLKCNDELHRMVGALRGSGTTKFDQAHLYREIETVMARPIRVVSHDELLASDSVGTNAHAPTSSGSASESIRINQKRLDDLINLVGELQILKSSMERTPDPIHGNSGKIWIGELNKITRELHEQAMSMRMVPLRPMFQSMGRMVREIASSLDKEVTFEMEGVDTELDKTVIEQIADPLMHLLRNAIDHGLESAEKRIQLGKSPVGFVRLSARQEGGLVWIEVEDDGRGLDAHYLISKAIEKGMLAPDSVLTDDEAYQLVFLPGFSTKNEADEISGRGVGMDVVKANVHKLQGKIRIDTTLGSGTRFRISLPLSMAMLDGMIVSVGEERYILPFACILESVRPEIAFLSDVSPIHGARTLQFRGETLPLYHLSSLLGRSYADRPASESVAIITRNHQDRPVTLLVDDILDQQQVVIKTLDEGLRGLPWLIGGAILSDGNPALILDIPQIVEAAA